MRFRNFFRIAACSMTACWTLTSPALAAFGDRDCDFGNGAAAVLRFTADGTPDPTFGTGGAVMEPAAGSTFYSLALRPDGRILATSPTVLAGYTPDGTSDASLGGGIVSLSAVFPAALF